MHISRKTTPKSESRKHSINSPQSVSNSQSPTTRKHSASPASLRSNSPVIISPETASDPKLNMKCAVIMKENEAVINYKKQQVAFINELLEKQREMQRQRALKRQEFQNILKQKREEGKRLMAEISQIKKQQAEAHEKVLEAQVHQSQQSPTILNRKRLLVRERSITFKTDTKVRNCTTTTSNRTNNVENDAESTDREIDATSAAIMQSVISDTFELPLSDGANRTSVAFKNIKATQVQDKKSTTSVRLTTGMINEEESTLTNSPKTRVQSTSSNPLTKLSAIEKVNSALQLSKANSDEKCEDDSPGKAIKTNISAILTPPMKTMQKTEEFTDTEIQGTIVPMTSKTSFTEQPKVPALLALAKTTPFTRCARSMTPTRGVYDTTKQSYIHTQRTTDNSLLNCSSSLSSPTSSKTRLQRAPSLSPSIFMNRNRVEVRRSMQDPTSNTDFSKNGSSWLLNASARAVTKTLKVRLKRLQHLNTNSTPPNFPEKESSDKISMPTSVMPIFLKEHDSNAIHTIANAVTESTEIPTLQFQIKKNKHKRVQFLKQQLKKELLEMDETYVRPVDTKDGNVQLQSAKDLACSQATQTAEGHISKVARRKPQRKAQHSNKKLKLLEKITIERHTNKSQLDLKTNGSTSAGDNAGDSGNKNAKTTKRDLEDGLQCDRNQETKEIVGDMSVNYNNDVFHNSGEIPIELSEIVAEIPFVHHDENTAKHQQFSPEPSRSDIHSIEDARIANALKEPTSNNSVDIDCSSGSDKKHKRTHKHGAIVTQVVDVTPGRHVNDNLLGDLLLTATANNSAVLNSNDGFKTTPKLGIIEPSVTELQNVGQVNEPCTIPTVDPSSFVKPNNLIPEGDNDKAHIEISNEMAVAVSSLAKFANRPITTTSTENCTNAQEFQNENVNTILPKKTTSESFSSDVQCVGDPTTVIGLQNDSQNHTIMSIDEHATIDEVKQRVVENPNDLVTLENDTGSISDDEESSSDCLLSQLSKRVHKMSDLESIADATAVHVIKDAAMTLMTFEATPTLPAYLLNGESRDVPTPPAIATPAPTPVPTPTAELTLEALPTPPLPDLMIKEDTHTPMRIDPIIREQLTKPNDSTDATVSVKVSEPAQENKMPLTDAPLQAQPELIKIGEGLSNNHLSPPLAQEQQLEEEVNSPAPASGKFYIVIKRSLGIESR